ncbi:MAG: alpha/beta fold hydrolase [Promethearchaeota archaeon]|nr:MAG: alpha/beta fold hydrolase [Candidatus Lokiarchaeota archaeon]
MERLTIPTNKSESEPQYDGPYEVSSIELQIDEDIFKGILYFPPKKYLKPYPVILFFHGFPQLFTLQEIIRKYQYLLDLGFAFIAINFRGYQYSEGKISISTQVSDGLKLVEFAKKMAEKNIFDEENINILAEDFGAYISLIVCSKTHLINKLLLLSPIIDLKKHVYENSFLTILRYIDTYLPGNVRGIDDFENFIQMTKHELSRDEFKLKFAIKNLKVNSFKIIIGEDDKITPSSELEVFNQFYKINPEFERTIIEVMEHEPFYEEEIKLIEKEIKRFFLDI